MSIIDYVKITSAKDVQQFNACSLEIDMTSKIHGYSRLLLSVIEQYGHLIKNVKVSYKRFNNRVYFRHMIYMMLDGCPNMISLKLVDVRDIDQILKTYGRNLEELSLKIYSDQRDNNASPLHICPHLKRLTVVVNEWDAATSFFDRFIPSLKVNTVLRSLTYRHMSHYVRPMIQQNMTLLLDALSGHPTIERLTFDWFGQVPSMQHINEPRQQQRYRISMLLAYLLRAPLPSEMMHGIMKYILDDVPASNCVFVLSKNVEIWM